MNENIDLTKILKDCPEGFEFHSPLCGKVEFACLCDDKDYPVAFTSSDRTFYLTKQGRYFADIPDGECMLLPSKDQRDWSKFTAPWNKKEKFDPKTLKVFDKVLVKVTNSKWKVSLFSHCDYNYVYPYVCIDGIYKYCIPYNDETMHLVGKMEEAPEYYKYWDD